MDWKIDLQKKKRMVLRSVFEPEREEETRGWRKLLNEGLHYLFFSCLFH
jgi:hypothetical protein